MRLLLPLTVLIIAVRGIITVSRNCMHLMSAAASERRKKEKGEGRTSDGQTLGPVRFDSGLQRTETRSMLCALPSDSMRVSLSRSDRNKQGWLSGVCSSSTQDDTSAACSLLAASIAPMPSSRPSPETHNNGDATN
ncbi:hypothetical protein B0T19DRAFT_408746 [Cercophora scortea]|uniref:Secreted protein n=1 Tax=Cercophora scortea TaxID=314031 RepID=A0AAE0J3F5_9PEZI|nr:hypothetical protein B0T19DRAFT_408746 [Cercophora scortea]